MTLVSVSFQKFQRLSCYLKAFEEKVIKGKNYQRYIFAFQTMKITVLSSGFKHLQQNFKTEDMPHESKSNIGRGKLQSVSYITSNLGICLAVQLRVEILINVEMIKIRTKHIKRHQTYPVAVWHGSNAILGCLVVFFFMQLKKNNIFKERTLSGNRISYHIQVSCRSNIPFPGMDGN